MNFCFITALLLGTSSSYISVGWMKNPRIQAKTPVYFSNLDPASDENEIAITVKAKDWQKETLESALSKREPNYLPKISDALGKKLNQFNKNKLNSLETKETLSKHAYALLFTMRAYNSVVIYPASNVIAISAANTAADVSGKAAVDSSNFPSLRLDSYANKLHAAKLGVAMNAARHASWESTWKTTWKATWELARNASWYLAWETTGEVTWETDREDYWTGHSAEEIGRIAFRIAEKVSLLYFLDNFDFLVGKTYDASMEKILWTPRENIFDSLDSWTSFKKDHFVNLNSQSMHFIQPWLDELDLIVEKNEIFKE